MEFMCRAFEETRNEKAIWIAKNLIEAGKMTFDTLVPVTNVVKRRSTLLHIVYQTTIQCVRKLYFPCPVRDWSK